MTGLDFAICPQCNERHALWHGSPTIHTTARGERCAPPPPAPIPARPAAPAPAKAKRPHKGVGKAPGREYDEDPERQAAFAIGRAHKTKRTEVQLEADAARAKARSDAKREEMLASMTVYERAVHEFYENEAREKAIAAKIRSNPLYGLERETQPLDRGIYQTRGAYPVRGGLPTLSKRAR